MALLICSNSAFSELERIEYSFAISTNFKNNVGAPQSSLSAYISEAGKESNSEIILNISICNG